MILLRLSAATLVRTAAHFAGLADWRAATGQTDAGNRIVLVKNALSKTAANVNRVTADR